MTSKTSFTDEVSVKSIAPEPAPAASSVAPAPPAASTISVIIKLPSGEAFPMSLPSSETVIGLKRRLASDQGVSSDRLTLTLGGKALENAATLAASGVANESMLKVGILEHAPRGPEFDLMVKLDSGKCTPARVAATDDVRELRGKVAAAERTKPAAITLTFKGTELRDGTSCGDAGLGKECIVKATVKELPPEPAPAPPATPEMAAPALSEEQKAEMVKNFAQTAKGKKVEVCFCFDTTGSMYSCLAQVRTNIEQTVTRLLKEIPDIRIAIMAIGDYCDAQSKYVVSICDLTSDADKICKFVRTVAATGGGDTPEAYEWGLHEARSLSWEAETSKAVVMIGDSPREFLSFDLFWPFEQLDSFPLLQRIHHRTQLRPSGGRMNSTSSRRWESRFTAFRHSTRPTPPSSTGSVQIAPDLFTSDSRISLSSLVSRRIHFFLHYSSSTLITKRETRHVLGRVHEGSLARETDDVRRRNQD